MISNSKSGNNVLMFDDENHMLKFMIEKWEDISQEGIQRKGYFTIGLSGGKTPIMFYQKLAEWESKSSWKRTHVFLVDERFVSFEDKDSNYRMLRETLFGKIPIPQENIHPIPTGKTSLETSAREYEEDLRRFFKVSKGQYPSFDLILLGIGEDGHTASLFPGSKALSECGHLTAAVVLDEMRHDRISLTLPVINHAEHVIFFVRGANKAPVLKKIIAGDDPSLPAAMVRPRSGNLLFVIDREASSQLSM
ncbi:MAG TPA: 6-phosphogluconolactonase [Thermodesulfobacteriota bacterium]|jgi:6-phosphogluconolactonase|nr:6-phosphogluconolactonase [Thermodesulfobacteriota bacterium]